MPTQDSALHKTLQKVIGSESADRLFKLLVIPEGVMNETGDVISRAGIAQAST